MIHIEIEFFEVLNRTRFALLQSETSDRSEVRYRIASRLESLNSCWVGRMLYDFEKCKVVSLAKEWIGH